MFLVLKKYITYFRQNNNIIVINIKLWTTTYIITIYAMKWTQYANIIEHVHPYQNMNK